MEKARQGENVRLTSHDNRRYIGSKDVIRFFLKESTRNIINLVEPIYTLCRCFHPISRKINQVNLR
jgi:hypothetical protein